MFFWTVPLAVYIGQDWLLAVFLWIVYIGQDWLCSYYSMDCVDTEILQERAFLLS